MKGVINAYSGIGKGLKSYMNKKGYNYYIVNMWFTIGQVFLLELIHLSGRHQASFNTTKLRWNLIFQVSLNLFQCYRRGQVGCKATI